MSCLMRVGEQQKCKPASAARVREVSLLFAAEIDLPCPIGAWRY